MFQQDRGSSSAAPRPPAPATLEQRVLRLQRRFQRLTRELDELCELIERLAFDLERFRDRLPGEVRFFRPVPRARKAPAVLRALAVSGASAIEITAQSDHSVLARIDGRKPFALSPKLGTLLAIIADPVAGVGKDGLLSWRTYGAVAGLLAVRTGRPQSAAGLTKHISKLKAAFHEAHENPHLIETDRHGGVRFRLRMATAPPGRANHESRRRDRCVSRRGPASVLGPSIPHAPAGRGVTDTG